MNDLLTRLRVATTDVERRDDALRAEMRERRDAAALVPERAGAALDPVVEIGGHQVDRFEFEQETIVLRTGRPVLAIVRDGAQLVFDDPESEVWKQRLQDSSSLLVDAARATGRIEVEGHSLAWLGTGWLVKSDVVVTNRHVAAEFGRHSGTSFVFRQGLNGRDMKASIDFLEEHGRSDSLMFRLEQILHIEDVDGPDIAFIRVSPVDGQSLATPVGLAMRPNEDELVAVIGYPARDSRIPDQPLMDRIFGDVYDKKRLAPGQVTRFDTEVLRHDCSTLGGNSGSAVISLRTGMAVGLHFAGRFLQTNFAVPSTVVGERLEQVLGDARRTRRGDHRVEEPVARRVADLPEPATSQVAATRPAGTTFSVVVPLRITVEVGDPYPDAGSNAGLPNASRNGQPGPVDPEDGVFTEAVPADYRDRLGYAETFLGDGAEVPLPVVTGGQDDVLTFPSDGGSESVLRYEHFSVLMSRSRRLCRFSAVNIDGLSSISMARVGWRTDPRIPLASQIRGECYGAEPKFSRGHMTRREDPIWGSGESSVKANADSMHVTNAVPQMQPFNAGVWLELENYALQHARQDDMRISVFTVSQRLDIAGRRFSRGAHPLQTAHLDPVLLAVIAESIVRGDQHALLLRDAQDLLPDVGMELVERGQVGIEVGLVQGVRGGIERGAARP